MGLFKKKKYNEIFSPCEGVYIPLNKVEDNFFSKGYAGDGFSIKPSCENVVSPVNGVVKTIFPTKHAIAIEGDNGIEILLHIGIDTVKLKGEGIEVFVSENQKIKSGDLIAKVNFDKVRSLGYLDYVLIIINNYKKLDMKIKNNNVKAGEVVANCE